MNKNLLLVGALSLVLTVGLASPAFAQESSNGITDTPSEVSVPAGPVTTDGQWFEFSFTNAGVDAKGCFPADPAGLGCVPSGGGNSVFADSPPWTLDCDEGGCWLTVTDAFLAVDQFEVLDFGAVIGMTSVPGGAPVAADITDPDDTSADPAFSSGQFHLGAGPHSITIVPLLSPTGSGAAYFKIEQHGEVAGELLPVDNTALFLAGLSQSAVWMIPTLAGIAGAGIVIRSKLHRD